MSAAVLDSLHDDYLLLSALHLGAEGTWAWDRLGGTLPESDFVYSNETSSPADFVPCLVPKDREVVAAAIQTLRQTQRSWHGNVPISVPSGSFPLVEVRLAMLKPSSNDTFSCLITFRDKSDLAAVRSTNSDLRAHWSAVSDVAGIGTISFQPSGDVVRLNAAAVTQLNATGRNPKVSDSSSFLALFHQSDQERVKALLFGAQSRPGISRLIARVPVSSSSKEMSLIEIAISYRDLDDKTIGTCRDVTRETQLEEMRRRKMAAERANKSKSAFMGQVSHELRTPLNGICGFTQLMLMDHDNPLPMEQRKRLEVIEFSGKRLISLIDQLLEISAIEQGKLSLTVRAVNVADAVDQCLNGLLPIANQAGVTLENLVPVHSSAAVQADPDALQQVLTNLVSNAIKFNVRGGSVKVSIELGKRTTLTISDTGTGLSETQIDNLFQPFNRLHAQGSSVPGHGLGLSITKRLLDSMSGTIAVSSREGYGSTFSVSLPSAPDLPSETAPSILEAPSRWDTGSRRIVLYIEDDQVNALLMDAVFGTQPDWSLLLAENGSDGIIQAVRQQPDLILLDMNLPDMSGSEVFKRLRAEPRTKHIPCIAVSADAMEDHINSALHAGFSDYWTKPLDLSSVISRLKGRLR